MSDIQPTESEHIEEQTALEAALRKALAWFSANLTTVIYALAAVLALAAIVVFLQRKPAGNAEASQLLLVASTPEEYQDVADSSPTSLLGMWSRLRQGDRLLDNAVTNLFMNREQGVEDLAAAKAAYENLGSQSGLPDALRERVLIGMARVAECECDGTAESVEAAETAWQQVIGAFDDSIVKQHCEDRIARLKTPEAAEFYQMFAALDPKPALPGASSVPEIPDGLLPNGFPGAPLDGMSESSEPEAAEPETADSAKTDDAAAEMPKDDSAADAKSEEGQPEKTDQPAKKEAAKSEAAEKAESVEAAEPAKVETPATAEKPTEAAKAKVEETAPVKKPETTDPQAAAKSEPETAKSDGAN